MSKEGRYFYEQYAGDYDIYYKSKFGYICSVADVEDDAKKLIDLLNEQNHRVADLEEKLSEKEKQYQDAVTNCVKLANKRAILKLKKVQDRIDDMKSKYDCDIEYHLGANNELTHLWEFIEKLIEEMGNGKR